MENTRIGFIGCGNMGRSLIGGLIRNGCDARLITGVDPDAAVRSALERDYGITTAPAPDGIHAEVIVLAVKPQQMEAAVRSIAGAGPAPLVISVAAGIRLAAIRAWLQRDLAVVRVMPNTPALIQAGVAVLIANGSADSRQRELAETIMRSVGAALWVEDESLLDTVTALSGSGPAYFFLLMEVLEDAAVKLGLPREQARLLTMETAFGAAKMVLECGQEAAQLRRNVTSPGGTTERALEVLQRADLDSLFLDALSAARDRSRELADAFGGAR